MKRRSLLAVEQIINRSARRIIVPSKFIFDILTERQKVNADKIDVVLYGFDPEKYSSVKEAETARVRSELGLDGRVVFGNFSRLHEEKGHRYLIEAARSVVRDIPEAVVLIVGEGQERAALEDQIAANGLEANVKLLGWRRDAMAIMSAVDVVVQSTLQEAFSQVMCEALWLGKPLIIPEVSGAVDIIDKDKGRLIKKADASALADAMIDLARNRLERARLGENGRAFVSRELTIDKMIGHYESSFRKAIAE